MHSEGGPLCKSVGSNLRLTKSVDARYECDFVISPHAFQVRDRFDHTVGTNGSQSIPPNLI
jgi:hypothetical protein